MGYESFAAFYDKLTENIDYGEIAAYYDGEKAKPEFVVRKIKKI